MNSRAKISARIYAALLLRYSQFSPPWRAVDAEMAGKDQDGPPSANGGSYVKSIQERKGEQIFWTAIFGL